MNIVSLMMGTAHKLESVTGRASWNVDDYGPEVAGDQQVGRTVEEFEAWLRDAERPPSFGRNCLDAIVADIGLTFEMSGKLYGEHDSDINEWEFIGEPNLQLSNGSVPTQMTTCTQLVNRIPDVIDAPAGFVTVEKLPRLRYRAFPFEAG